MLKQVYVLKMREPLPHCSIILLFGQWRSARSVRKYPDTSYIAYCLPLPRIALARGIHPGEELIEFRPRREIASVVNHFYHYYNFLV